MDETDKSVNYFETTIKEMPYLVDAYDALLGVRILQPDYEAACELLDRFVNDLDLEKEFVVSFVEEDYPVDFTESDYFLEWAGKEKKKSKKKRKKKRKS